MSENQASNNNKDQRPLVLLALGLAICCIHLVDLGPVSSQVPSDNAMPAAGTVDLWLSGSHIDDGLYRLPQSLPLHELYHALGVVPPARTWSVSHYSNLTALQLEDYTVPVDTGLSPKLAPLFLKPIPINKASKEVLQTIPGIGPRLAERLVVQRDAGGGFSSLGDLLTVNGIGRKKLERLGHHLTFE